jgi:serine/threonine-protein kinase
MPPGESDRTTRAETFGTPAPGSDRFELRAGGQFGRYLVEGPLGEGGLGTVFRAHDPVLDRPVALKIPKFVGDFATASARFLREARSAAQLQHPNICPVYDFGVIGDTPFLVMALVRGEPLGARVAPDRPMDPGTAARLVCRLAGPCSTRTSGASFTAT